MTDLTRNLVARLLAEREREEIVRYLYNQGRATEDELAAMLNGAGVSEEVYEIHLPMLIDYGIVERDGDFIVQTDDVGILLEVLDSMEYTLTQHRPEDARNRPS